MSNREDDTPIDSSESPSPRKSSRDMISTADTVFPRYMAATLDNFLALILGVAAAESVDEDQHALQTREILVLT